VPPGRGYGRDDLEAREIPPRVLSPPLLLMAARTVSQALAAVATGA